MEHSEVQIQVENAGTIIENSTIQAEQVAGRDIYNYAPAAPSFAQVQLDYFGSEDYLAPTISEQAFHQLKKQHILLIYGGKSFDKGGFIRHLAFKLQKETQYQPQELEINEENESLYHQINKNVSKCIYLLDRLHPQHVDYDLPRLQALAASKSTYVIISTDISLNVWQLNPSDTELYTYHIPDDELYEKATLMLYLEKKLLNETGRWGHQDLEKVRGKKVFLDTPLESIVSSLNNPEKLNLFMLRLKNEANPTPQTVQNIVNSLSSTDEGIVRKWFMSLSSRQKLIALGAALLEGADDDQFFSIIGRVIEKMWKHSDESLQALDYCDLDFLSDFFRFENLGAGRQVLQSKFANQKIEIIKGSWHLYSRHLLSVIPIFSDSAIQSLDTKSADWANFGTRQKRANFRMVIGQTISEIGLVSTFSVENTLIAFAAHYDDRIKRIASKSLARWREFEEDEKLFALIKSWLTDERPQKIISEYLAKREGWQDKPASQEMALRYLRATAIHALSYSANYDSPNQLHQGIIGILQDLVSERNESVVVRALQAALPKLVHHHVLQLKDVLLEQFMKYDHMVEPVAEGLLKAYKDYPNDLKVTLDRWFEDCLENNSKQNRRKKLTHRDKVLVTILEVYGQIAFDEPKTVITLEEVYQKLYMLVKTEQRRFVRDAIFLTMARLMPWDRALWETKVPIIWYSGDFQDADPLIECLFSVFVEERKYLKGSPYSFHWKGEDFPIWLDLYNRPKTSLEIKMGNWVRSNHDALKKLAVLCFLKIAKSFELDEIDGLKAVRTTLWDRQNGIQPSIPVTAPVSKTENLTFALSWYTRLRIFFLLLFRPKADKGTLKLLLVTLYEYRYRTRKHRSHIRIMLKKWAFTESSLLQKLSRWLRRLT